MCAFSTSCQLSWSCLHPACNLLCELFRLHASSLVLASAQPATCHASSGTHAALPKALSKTTSADAHVYGHQTGPEGVLQCTVLIVGQA
eukprot:scaffold259162_cov18-Tisochrysis_lutea.AAC.1